MITNLAFLALAALAAPSSSEDACGPLRDLSQPNTTITRAELVPAGPYTVRRFRSESIVELPAHCRVTAVLAPSADSHIEMEIWLPVEHWNGKFLAVGNGGWAGSISYSAMVTGLTEGYATAGNDTGHQSPGASFALGHPEKLVDFAYRAMHEMTLASKAIVAEHYDEGLELSYYAGCSTGGRQGLMAAQRYPGDFDAIVAGAPANPQILKHTGDLHRSSAVLRNPENLVPREKVVLLHEAVVNACDALDGVEDGLLTDPSSCSFDPETLRCDGIEDDRCLTPAQVETMRIAYAPVTTTGGEVIYSGYSLGTELSWNFVTDDRWLRGTSMDTFKYVVHQDPDWDWKTFDLDRDLPLALESGSQIDATSADLSAFKERGGKLLLYHGWSDGAIVPQNTIDYYQRVLKTMGPSQDDWVRLFMAPGMGHCAGGEGPDQVRWLSVLERWREADNAPDEIITHRVRDNRVDMTRPLCPYPAVATWTGTGSTNDAANFTCEAP